MRRIANVDRSQAEIIAALRRCAITVQPLHTVGSGVPDLLCGYRGVNVLLELKNGDDCPSRRALTAAEADWHAKWGGQVAVVATPREAIDTVIEAAMAAGRLL